MNARGFSGDYGCDVTQAWSAMPLAFVIPQAGGCHIHAFGGKTRSFPCKTRDIRQAPWLPIRVQPIGAVCYIPRLRAQRDNVTKGRKALPGDPGAAPPRRSKRVPTVALR